jgi:beta-barrel assembly-enhancing protease
MKKLVLPLFMTIAVLIAAPGCKDDDDGFQPNIFTLQDDIDLGMQLRDEILSNPSEYPVINRLNYPEAYNQIGRAHV